MTRLNLLVVGLGNYHHPLTRHSISQLALENVHLLLNTLHRSNSLDDEKLRITTDSCKTPPSLYHHLQSQQPNAEMSPHMKLSKADSAWIARHTFQVSPKHPTPSTTTEESSVTFHLFKARTAMNITGPIVRAYHSQLTKKEGGDQTTRLILIHDELDLKPLAVKLKLPPQSSKHRGHNGLRSVFSSLKNFPQDRLFTIAIGVGRDPLNPDKDPDNVARWVLSPLYRNEIQACSFAPDLPSNSLNNGLVVNEIWKKMLAILATVL